MPRSGSSESTAPANPRCCASWRASTPSSPAKPGPPRERAWAISSRSRHSLRARAGGGYLEQEPQPDAAKSVRENVMEAVAPQKGVIDRYNELATNYSDETAD